MASVATAPTVSLRDYILNNVVESLHNTPSCNEPFSNFFAQNFFPEDVYWELLDNFPPDSQYAPISENRMLDNGTYSRSVFDLDRPSLDALPERARELWDAVASALLSPQFKAAVFRLVQKDLAFRFKIKPQDFDSIPARPWLRLLRDITGYEIAPHPDTRKKVVTMMVYMPRDASQVELGTSLYKFQLNARGLKNKRELFKEVKRFPFLPNSAFAFAVNNSLRKKSWHGRDRLDGDAGQRNSLMTTFYVPDSIDFQSPF